MTDNVVPMSRPSPDTITLPWVAPWPTFEEAHTNLARWCGEVELEGYDVDRLDDGSPRQPTWIVPSTPWPFRPSAGFALVTGRDLPRFGVWYRVVRSQGMVVGQRADDLPPVTFNAPSWAVEELARVLHLHGYRPLHRSGA